MPKIDIAKIEETTGSRYPGKLSNGFEKRRVKRLGDAGGLIQFGVNLVTLEPGGMSSLRHWHMEQDEFLIMVKGVLTLIDDDGACELHPGEAAAFAKGDANGHHIVNKSDQEGSFLVVGTRTPTEIAYYSDIDMKYVDDGHSYAFTKRDGAPVEE